MTSRKLPLENVDNKTPERPGRISKNLLTPCRQVGLSRKRKTPALTQKASSGVVGSSDNSRMIHSTDVTSESAIRSNVKKLDALKNNLVEPLCSRLPRSQTIVPKEDPTDFLLEHANNKPTCKEIKKTKSSKQVISNSASFETIQGKLKDSSSPQHNDNSQSQLVGTVNTGRKSGSKREVNTPTLESGNSSDYSFSPIKCTNRSSKRTKKSKRIVKKFKINDTSDSDEDSDWQPQSASDKSKPKKSKPSKKSNSPTKLANVSVKISRIDNCDKDYSSTGNKSNVDRKIDKGKLAEIDREGLPKQCGLANIEENISDKKENVPESKENAFTVQETVPKVKKDINTDNQIPSENKSTPGKPKPFRKSLSMKRTYSDDCIEFESNIDIESPTYNTQRNKIDEELDCFHINNIISQHPVSNIESANILDPSDDFTSTPDEDRLGRDKLLQQISQLEECIKTKKGRLSHLKQTKVYQKLHNTDDLKKLFITWKKGCIQALSDLLPHLASHTEIDMPTLLKNLRIPPELISISQQHQLI